MRKKLEWFLYRIIRPFCTIEINLNDYICLKCGRAILRPANYCSPDCYFSHEIETETPTHESNREGDEK